MLTATCALDPRNFRVSDDTPPQPLSGVASNTEGKRDIIHVFTWFGGRRPRVLEDPRAGADDDLACWRTYRKFPRNRVTVISANVDYFCGFPFLLKREFFQFNAVTLRCTALLHTSHPRVPTHTKCNPNRKLWDWNHFANQGLYGHPRGIWLPTTLGTGSLYPPE